VTTFEKDEFDMLADQAGPVGVHRKPRSLLARLLPYAGVFLAAGLLTYLAIAVKWNLEREGPITLPGTVQATETSPAPTTSALPVSPGPTAAPIVTEAPAPTIDRSLQVVVFNDAGIGGLAATVAETLATDGFTDVVADNWGGDTLPQNTVRYGDPAHAATAQQVAAVLGITAIEQVPTSGAWPIEVVLVTGPA